MLETLTIKDFAIIDHIEINFQNGMTVLSGETGAGKSIIIDALGILCGGRGSSEFIRHGSERLIVEGLFAFDKLPQTIFYALEDVGIKMDADENTLIIRREITKQGRNVIRINGQLANVTILKTIGNDLVDIHGQNEHQALLDQAEHLRLLDQFGSDDHQQLLIAYKDSYTRYQQARAAYLAAHQDQSDDHQRLSFLEFQLNELEEAALEEGEYEVLEEKSKKLQHMQHTLTHLNQLNEIISDNDQSVLALLSQSEHLLQEIVDYHSDYPDLMNQLSNLRYELEELSHQLANTSSDVEIEDESIDQIESRLAYLSSLKRKYNMDIEDIIQYAQDISEEIYQLNHKEEYLEDMEKQLVERYQEAYQLAQQLHESRKKLSSDLVRAIEAELKALYMENSQFEVAFEKVKKDAQLSDLGHAFDQLTIARIDHVEFYVSTNVGEDLKPLVKVASGGELSRFMLALKTVFGRKSIAKVMVFDEIDTGVSGRVAQAIAEKIKANADRHQVLCITHLAQVAAISDHQLYIQKEVADQRTRTTIQNLTPDARVQVIAGMMSGKEMSDSSLQLAKEMLANYQPSQASTKG